ncbi:hypothetical protein [Marinobacterium lutimaris]|uniref:Uncharacterized protein n=1 Tax=Marinobacterium lutimaris TaxID=568106 RepID=A0A1H5XSY0_9GAMM|nr:hypothetical protein [Marinobacterium lutimaris]SEG14831.1 hypothetical protein SAMN05444390_1011493 [Marinobacterium lutimaris]
MSDFDDIMAEADADIFEELGELATVSDGSIPASTWERRVVIDKDLSLILNGEMTVIGTVVTINNPPAGIDNEWQVIIASGRNAGTYVLRQLIERDNWVGRWAATVEAAEVV